MAKPWDRVPRNYDGVEPTARPIKQLLPSLLKKIGAKFDERPDLVLAAWPHIIGEKLAPMTEAVSFNEGMLVVKVKNSTLHSLLSQHEKPRLLKSLRDKFPSVTIRNIIFRMG